MYAWLLQGNLEICDDWLIELPTGEFRPKEDLDLAKRSFEKTVALSPGLQGAYGGESSASLS